LVPVSAAQRRDARDVDNAAREMWREAWERAQKDLEQALFDDGLREVFRRAYQQGVWDGARRWY
jgi:hypothetical protein